MIDPPKRTGYRLTYDAECLYNDWQEIGGCSCHTGCAPCSSCCAEGHPISLEENDEAWEEDTVGNLVKVRIKPAHFHEVALYLPYQMGYNANTVFEARDYCDGWLIHDKVFHKKVFDIVEEEGMARDNITDKSSPPKSEWFGFKYRVTPESSKLLQEAVFKDGGGWGYTRGKNVAHIDQPFLVVRGGEITYSNDEHYFQTCIYLPEKQPPQPKPQFKSGDKVRIISDSNRHKQPIGKIVTLCNIHDRFMVSAEFESLGKPWGIEESYNTTLREQDIELVVAKDIKESKLGTPKTILEAVNFVHDFKPNDFSITKEDVNIMSNQNRVVSVKFFDDDAGLKAENSLVASYEITTRANDAMTVNKLLMREDIAGDIDLHNEVRASTVDATILKNTGNKVFLQPIDFEDLRVEVRQV